MRQYNLNYKIDELQDDKKYILKIVSKYGYALQFASSRLRDDEDVVFVAYKTYNEALQYASPRLQEYFSNKFKQEPQNNKSLIQSFKKILKIS